MALIGLVSLMGLAAIGFCDSGGSCGSCVPGRSCGTIGSGGPGGSCGPVESVLPQSQMISFYVA